jgi:NTP pyrophosphatase (non-canonical NTP hydrolase)
MTQESKFEELSARIEEFVKDRDWEQYHNPKNLSMAIAVEAAELLEIFQWLSPDECDRDVLSQEQKNNIADELADIIIYVVRMAQVLNIDVLEAVERKIEKNELKYPVEQIKGKATL